MSILSPAGAEGEDRCDSPLNLLHVRRSDLKRIDLLRVEEFPAAEFMLPGESEGGPKS